MMDILLIEDEESIRDVLKSYFLNEGWNVRETDNGKYALQLIQNFKMDLVVLDLMIDGMPGEDVCCKIRQFSTVPIIMITSKVKESDTINGLNLGADDYITKPFRVKEVIARIYALKRRMDMFTNDKSNAVVTKRFNQGRFVINYTTNEVYVDGRRVELTHTEFKLLSVLTKTPGKIYSRQDLTYEIHGYRNIDVGRTMDMHIRNLRSKIEPDPKEPKYIVTKIGAGYKFDVQPEAQLS
ncbi:response regulator transcription factor [Paenibacillus cisolokensis]|jgi:Response regulators consisting of a CheY-like receiver domain and a winged-helix DNA-binding domain|nr:MULTISPECIES: response regulator transcription factor [Paenibacillus]ALS29066.1 two-component system response regulator [Paenibacillus sp. 32O-W]